MRTFLQSLMDDGEVRVVDRPVDSAHELAAVTRRVQQTSNEVVVFNHVAGTRFPVVSNVYGSRERIARVLGADVRDFCRAFDARVRSELPKVGRTVSGSPPELEHGRLSELPLLSYSEHDAGPYFTSAVFLAREPETGVANLSFHRSMYVSDAELRVRMAPRHDLARYHQRAEELGRPLEAALMIGVPPAMFLAAAARLDYDEDELALAAQLAGRPIEMRRCETLDLEVPVDAEIVIEGRFLPSTRRQEGPFGEFMGYYVAAADNAVFEVLDVSWRRGALFHSINCGSAEEVLPLGLLSAARTYRLLSSALPDVLDVVHHPVVNHTVIQLDQQYAQHSAETLALAMAPPVSCKMCSVVDPDVDIYDFSDVLWAILTRARPDGNLQRLPSVPSFHRDPQQNWGRFGVDACAPFDNRDAYLRTRIPGADDVELSTYF